MSNQQLTTNEQRNDDYREPESSSRMFNSKDFNESSQKKDIKKAQEEENQDNNNDINKFNIEKDYLPLDECTAINLGPERIYQKCFVCRICNPKNDHYICKFCYFKCHQKCRSILKIEQKQEDFKGDKEFACFCGNKLKHKPEDPQKQEQKTCDLIVLDRSLEVGLFYCETHKLSICCVCSVECHKKCKVRKYKEKNPQNEPQCLCKNENHTTYNEIALTFPLDEYQKLSGVAVWPIQIVNILFNQRRFGKLSNLFKAMLNKEEISDEEKKKFFPLLELFSNTFNRKFKTLYYEKEIINMFNYEKLVEYIKNLEANNKDMILLKFRLIFILLFVHLKNDFQTTKSLTSIDFLCGNVLERIEYKKILMKKNIFNEKIDEKYNLSKLMEKNNELKDLIIKDVCNLMSIGIEAINIEENSEDFEIGLKLICFMTKIMLFTKEDLINLINSLYSFFSKFFEYITSEKCNIFLLLNLFCGFAELFLMISVNYNDLIVMDYLDKYKSTTNINKIDLKDDFIHVSSEHGNKLFKMVMKSCELLKKHYNLLNVNEENIKDDLRKINKNKNKMKKFIVYKKPQTYIKIPKNQGLFLEKIISEFTECLGIFCLADNIYFKQISLINKEDLVSYYNFCNRIEGNKNENLTKNEIDSFIEKIKNVKLEIEDKFQILFTSSYSNQVANVSDELKQLLLNFSSEINGILNEYANRKNLDNDEQDMNSQNIDINELKRFYIKNEKDSNEIKEGKVDKINYYLTKIAFKNKRIYPFLNKESFSQVCEELVDNLIISNLDETITKILVFFSNRKYPNLLSYDLLDVIYSTLSLYLFSKRGIKYLLFGKVLVRINKIINRYNYNSNQKNINPSFGKTEETNITFINRTFEFCSDLFKGMNLYDLSIRYHKVLLRLKKNMLDHICLFNKESKENNSYDFLLQFKFMMKIFFYLSDDFEYEDLDQIKRQCVFILKQNPLDLLEKKSFFSTYKDIPDNLGNLIDDDKEDKLALKNNKNKLNKKKTNSENINNDIFPERNKTKVLLSLYFSFFRLFGKKTFFIYENKENNAMMNLIYNFNDLNEFKKNLGNNNITLKQRIILLRYLRSVYFIDHLDQYDIFQQKYHLTTMEFHTLIRCNAILDEKYENCLNLKEPLSLPQNIVKELMDKYNLICQLEIVAQIYLNEIRMFPRQLLGNSMEYCKIYYRQILFDLKYLSNYFYTMEYAWSKFNILFYQICLEFIPKIDIFRNVFYSLKGDNDTVFNIGEELYLIPLDKDADEEFEHRPGMKKKFDENIANSPIPKDEEWDSIKLEAYKTIQKLKSISFDIYNTKAIYSYLNEYIDMILKFSKLNQFYYLQGYLGFFDVTAEANFTPFCLLETIDYEYFYEDMKQKKDELVKKDPNLYKLYKLRRSFMDSFIDINNTNFMDIITKIINDDAIFDFNKTFVDLFKNFINSKEGNHFHILKLLVCILAKMFFYYNEGMQDKLVDFINDKEFFPNMNKLLNIYLVLVLSLSKNIYAYFFVHQLNTLSKLLIQLLQSLGEGFNTKYHNNIFKYQKDIPLLEKDDEDTDEDDNDEKSSDFDSNQNSNNLIEDDKDDELMLANPNNLKGNKIYKTKLRLEIPNIAATNTIYDSLIISLKYALNSLDMENLIEGEMPYDKLMISITNIFDFLIEYIESEGENNEIIKNSFKNLLFGKKSNKPNFEKTNLDLLNEKPFIDSLFTRIEPSDNGKKLYLLRKKIICFIKFKFANFLIYYLLTGGKESMIDKLIKNNCSPIDLFTELVYNFKEMLEHLKMKNPELIMKLETVKKSQKTSDFVDTLIEFYGYKEDFRNQIEFQVIIQYYILIKIFDEFYNHKELKSHFETVKDNFDDSSDLDDYHIRSKFSYCVYLFLEQIILKVEIRVENEDDQKIENKIEENKHRVADLVMKNIKSDPFIHKMKKIVKNIKNGILKEDFDLEEFLESEEESESDEENSKKGIKTAFFLRPYLTFTLRKSSKIKFIKNVDRSNASQKFASLVNFSDYCLFEMVLNRHLIGNSKFKKFLANINYFAIELINYLIIIINNAFIMYHFYKSPKLPIEEYELFDESQKSTQYIDNMLISAVQAVILIIMVIIYYCFEFNIHFEYSVMKRYNKKFVLKKSGEDSKISQTIIDYFQDKDVSSSSFFKEVNKNVSGWQKFYIGLFESTLLNREINIYIFTIILNILFITIRSYLCIVVEVLFIINIFPTLFDIFKAIKSKYLHIIMVLLFNFLTEYVFMWFGFFFFQDFFKYDDILEPISGELISENYCYSSVQCLLYYITMGTRSGGGIMEVISPVSYKKDVKFYFGRFFNDILFFLIVNLILGNVFLGIIIDTFSELRDIQTENENDRKNICFICQLSSDACLARNIDFDKHVNNIHNIWNYVYFLNYLHLSNPNSFNRVEDSVWKKLEEQDYSWLPIDKNSDN